MYLLINTYGQLHYIYCQFTHEYNPVIDRGVGSPGHGKDVVDGLNANYNMFLSVLMKNAQLPDAATNNSQVFMDTSISSTDISLEK